MNRFEQLRRFHHDHQLKAYTYAFMYAYPQTVPVEAHFTDSKTFVVNYQKMSTKGQAPKYWLVSSYIRSEDYDLDHNFDDTEIKNQSENLSKNKVNFL